LGKACEYPAGRKQYNVSSSHQDTSSSSPASVISSASMDGPRFPDVFFLDTALFYPVSHASLQNITCPVPTHVAKQLGPETNIICERYFSSIDKWFPFISRKRLSQHIQGGPSAETPGLALLLLCMHLISDNSHLSRVPAKASILYRTARSYLNTVEETTPVSIQVFQSLVLIALYEIGHSIFPTAYLTIGRAARIGILMGVHDRKNTTQLFQTPKTWTYWEEERRTWWAVLILERLAACTQKSERMHRSMLKQ
jgi:hypothetical protein